MPHIVIYTYTIDKRTPLGAVSGVLCEVLMPDPHKIFDALAELVYISDIESHDLLYMNEPMRKLVGPEWRSMKCYEALHDKTEPCGLQQRFPRRRCIRTLESL